MAARILDHFGVRCFRSVQGFQRANFHFGEISPAVRARRISFQLSPSPGLSSPRSTMETPASSPPWQPITFGGVAAFSRASFGRLFLVQFIVALLVAASVLCFLISAWFPVIHEAIARLPEKGAIRRGQLDWAGPSPAWLAEGPCLAIIVDTAGGGRN